MSQYKGIHHDTMVVTNSKITRPSVTPRHFDDPFDFMLTSYSSFNPRLAFCVVLPISMSILLLCSVCLDVSIAKSFAI